MVCGVSLIASNLSLKKIESDILSNFVEDARGFLGFLGLPAGV
jgi:hypothetical protein